MNRIRLADHLDVSVPPTLPTGRGTLLCLGSAPEFIEHGEAFRAERPDAAIMACNDAIRDWPHRLDFAVSLHADLLQRQGKAWLVWRKDRPVTVSTRRDQGVDHVIRVHGPCASSGMLMILAGLCMGYGPIALAGVTLSREPDRNFHPHWRRAFEAGLLHGVLCLTPGWVAELLNTSGAPSHPERRAPGTSSPGPAKSLEATWI